MLKALEDAGRVRRGYFVGVGATQFALPAALELLRSLRDTARRAGDARRRGHRSRQSVRHDAEVAACQLGDAATTRTGRAPTRTVGALVVLVNGALAAYVAARRPAAHRLPAGRRAGALDDRAARSRARWRRCARDEQRGGLLIAEINGQQPRASIRWRRS